MAEPTEAQHGPLPWRIDPDDRPGMKWNNHIVDADGNRVCFMAHDGTEENERGQANAKLIVEATEGFGDLRDEMKKIALATGRSETDGEEDCDWAFLGEEVAEIVAERDELRQQLAADAALIARLMEVGNAD